MLRVRFRVYAPNGALIGSLPSPISWEMGVPLNDMPSLRIEYHPDAPGADLLNSPCEVVLEIQDPSTGNYAEYPGCRFLNLRNSGDRLDPAGVVTYQMPNYGWQLRKVRNIEFESFDEDGSRTFLNATPGEIIAAFINESKARGNIPQLSIDFNGTIDSDGDAWENQITISVDPGRDVWSLLDAFTRQGLCDWRMNGRTLQIYNPDGFLNRDLTADPAIILRPFIDHRAEPNDSSIEDLEFKALVQGDENAFLEVENPTAISPWGEWEGFITQGGVSNATTMELLATYVLQGRSDLRVQMTRELVFRDGRPMPLVNYRPGDHILSTDEDGNQTTDLRVFQITLSSADEGTVQGNITLNDRFIERDLRNQRAINGLTGIGGPSSGGGTGSNPTPPPNDDTRQPAAPQGLVVNSSTYINELGEPIGQATATWDQVTESTGGSPVDIDNYEVQSRLQTLPEGFETRTFVADPQTQAFVGPLDVGRTYVFRVRARGENGRTGPWSSNATVLIQADDESPPAPSVPILSSRLGTIRVTWDGLNDVGGVMPTDLREVQVEMSTTGAGPWELIGSVFAQGSVIVTDLPYEATRFFRFLAIDTSGNQSDPSVVASIQVVRVEGPDIEANSITTNHLTAGSVTAEKVAAYSLTADRLAIGAMRNIVADGNFADADLSAHRVQVSTGSPNSSSSIVWSWTGNAFRAELSTPVTGNHFGRAALVNSTLLDTDLAAGETLPSPYYGTSIDPEMGNVISRMGVNVYLSSGTWPSGAEIRIGMFARYYDGDGNSISTALTIAEQSFTAPTGGITTMQSTTGSTVPTSAVSAIIYPRVVFDDVPGTNVIVEFSTVFSAQAFGEVLIENGAISAPKIQANAITTTQLDADAITAKHTITGSFIQTASGGIRVTMGPDANFLDQPGIRLWSNNDPNHSANVFVADIAGTGDWDPQSFAIVGPENIRNSSGRSDLNLQMGGGFHLAKKFVTENTLRSGIYAPTASSELLLQGSAPRGDAITDGLAMFRMLSIQFGTLAGSVTWGLDNGWVYRTQATVYNSSSTASARYVSIRARSTSGFGYIASGTSFAIETLSIRGGYIIG